MGGGGGYHNQHVLDIIYLQITWPSLHKISSKSSKTLWFVRFVPKYLLPRLLIENCTNFKKQLWSPLVLGVVLLLHFGLSKLKKMHPFQKHPVMIVLFHLANNLFLTIWLCSYFGILHCKKWQVVRSDNSLLHTTENIEISII